MRTLHVGGGTTRGAMTVFPIWGEFAPVQPHAAAPDAVQVVEREGGASVGMLQVQNLTDVPAIVFEGQVLEGGWQNRMVARSSVVAARATSPVDVVCIEEGRWGGGRAHRTAGRRASGRMRSGLQADDPQQAVWNRVREYESAYGSTRTSSFTEHADRLDERVGQLAVDLRPLPGQVGVLVAVSGQPTFAEIFADHDTLVREFDAIVRAAGIDALGLPVVETPSRRARRFVDRASRVRVGSTVRAGLGQAIAGRDPYVQVSGLRWDGADAHLVLTNPRHELNRVPA